MIFDGVAAVDKGNCLIFYDDFEYFLLFDMTKI